MKILFVYRHFWPDSPPYASMLRTISRHLVEQGHTVEVWTEMPTYQDAVGNIDPARSEVVDGVEAVSYTHLTLPTIYSV